MSSYKQLSDICKFTLNILLQIQCFLVKYILLQTERIMYCSYSICALLPVQQIKGTTYERVRKSMVVPACEYYAMTLRSRIHRTINNIVNW